MRVPYLPNPPRGLSETDQQIAQRIATRRADDGLLPLDLVLLHAPEIANGWDVLFSAIRNKSSLPDHLRELAIVRTAVLNKAWYEWGWHAPLLRETEAFKQNPNKMKTVANPKPIQPRELNEVEWAVLTFADEMTTNINPSDDCFNKLRTVCHFSNQEIVELTATVSSYNFASRFLVALDIGEKNGEVPDEIRQYY
ncbi:carboxymuconolactone decarboxylase [Ilyonectria robusta]|uniref:carboxymuconolactone decarboxylase n=1 Tax=Ilyonectria robusta TaxID=1079257 RepID=UPI001E8CCAD2|nr:carboxymuconolactone decarboxylase [Ilyonectria robusta]KAH8663228.1 carboxymuconolactone decarboxylase [Ilyonectria robusta]